MPRTVTIRPRADQDIDDFCNYFSINVNNALARRFLEELQVSFDLIAERP